MLQGGTLIGRVLDDRGTLIADAEVEINGSRSGVARATLTASDGVLRIRCAVPAEVVISVTRREDIGRIALRKTVSVGEGERGSRSSSPCPRRRATPVQVVVTDEDGQPIELAKR